MRKTEPGQNVPGSFPRATAVRPRKESRTGQGDRGAASFRRGIVVKRRRNSKSDQGDNSEATSRETPNRDLTVPRNPASEGKPKRSSSRDRNGHPAACALAAVCGEAVEGDDAARHRVIR